MSHQAFSLHEAQVVFEYERLSQEVDPGLPPFLQAKQVAQAALNEDFTLVEVQSILRDSPRFKEIEEALGSQKADEFSSIAITAAQRQIALDSVPEQPILKEPQSRQQLQPRIHST